MKRSTLLFLAAFSLFAAAAQGAPSHFALGRVQAVDAAAGTATIAHDPVASLKWPAMTMQFRVAGPAVLDRLPKGGQIAFEFAGEDGNWRIVNAIPLAQAPDGARAKDSHPGMHDGMGGAAMSGMGSMRDMCMDMMGGRRR